MRLSLDRSRDIHEHNKKITIKMLSYTLINFNLFSFPSDPKAMHHK